MQWVPCKVNVTYLARAPLSSYFYDPQNNEIYFLIDDTQLVGMTVVLHKHKITHGKIVVFTCICCRKTPRQGQP